MNLAGPLPMILYLTHGKNNPLVSELNEILGREASLRKVQKWPISDSELFEFNIVKYLSPKRFSELQEKFKGTICLK